jgi:hypothetical protein
MRLLWLAREQRLYQTLFGAVDDGAHRQWLAQQAAVAAVALRRVTPAA